MSALEYTFASIAALKVSMVSNELLRLKKSDVQENVQVRVWQHLEHDQLHESRRRCYHASFNSQLDEPVDDTLGTLKLAAANSEQLVLGDVISARVDTRRIQQGRTRYNIAMAMMTSAAAAPPSQTMVRR